MNSKIAPGARIGHNVIIGDFTSIHDDVILGDNTIVGDHCTLGGTGGASSDTRLEIGPDSIIRSHTMIYSGSRFGRQLETGHHVLVREGTECGDNLRIGSFTDIEGSCKVGNYCRFHGYVHVGQGSEIGNFVWLYSQVTLTNDPLPPSNIMRPVTIRDGVVVCVGCTLMPGTMLEEGSYVCAGAAITGRVPAGAVVAGDNGRIVSHVCLLADFEAGIRHPWMDHFANRYPEAAQQGLQDLANRIKAEHMRNLQAEE